MVCNLSFQGNIVIQQFTHQVTLIASVTIPSEMEIWFFTNKTLLYNSDQKKIQKRKNKDIQQVRCAIHWALLKQVGNTASLSFIIIFTFLYYYLPFLLLLYLLSCDADYNVTSASIWSPCSAVHVWAYVACCYNYQFKWTTKTTLCSTIDCMHTNTWL